MIQREMEIFVVGQLHGVQRVITHWHHFQRESKIELVKMIKQRLKYKFIQILKEKLLITLIQIRLQK